MNKFDKLISSTTKLQDFKKKTYLCIKTIGSMVNGWHWKEKWSETDQEDWTIL